MSDEEKRKIHWGKWEKLCEHKERGGLGFKNLERFNQALLAKSDWRVLRVPTSLGARVLKASYFPTSSILEASSSSYSSSLWNGLLWGRNVIEIGSRWLIGSGDSVEAR